MDDPSIEKMFTAIEKWSTIPPSIPPGPPFAGLPVAPLGAPTARNLPKKRSVHTAESILQIPVVSHVFGKDDPSIEKMFTAIEKLSAIPPSIPPSPPFAGLPVAPLGAPAARNLPKKRSVPSEDSILQIPVVSHVFGNLTKCTSVVNVDKVKEFISHSELCKCKTLIELCCSTQELSPSAIFVPLQKPKASVPKKGPEPVKHPRVETSDGQLRETETLEVDSQIEVFERNYSKLMSVKDSSLQPEERVRLGMIQVIRNSRNASASKKSVLRWLFKSFRDANWRVATLESSLDGKLTQKERLKSVWSVFELGRCELRDPEFVSFKKMQNRVLTALVKVKKDLVNGHSSLADVHKRGFKARRNTLPYSPGTDDFFIYWRSLNFFHELGAVTRGSDATFNYNYFAAGLLGGLMSTHPLRLSALLALECDCFDGVNLDRKDAGLVYDDGVVFVLRVYDTKNFNYYFRAFLWWAKLLIKHFIMHVRPLGFLSNQVFVHESGDKISNGSQFLTGTFKGHFQTDNRDYVCCQTKRKNASTNCGKLLMSQGAKTHSAAEHTAPVADGYYITKTALDAIEFLAVFIRNAYKAYTSNSRREAPQWFAVLMYPALPHLLDIVANGLKHSSEVRRE